MSCFRILNVIGSLCGIFNIVQFTGFFLGWNTNSSLEGTKTIGQVFVELYQVSLNCAACCVLDGTSTSYKNKNIFAQL